MELTGKAIFVASAIWGFLMYNIGKGFHLTTFQGLCLGIATLPFMLHVVNEVFKEPKP